MSALSSTLTSSFVVLTVGVSVFAATAWSLHRFRSEVTARDSVEIAAFAVGIVGLIFTGIWIPNKISEDSNTRQDRATCFDAVLALRKNVDEVRVNYVVAPQQYDRRMADWDSLGTSLEDAYFGCQHVHLDPPATTADLASIRTKYPDAKQNSKHLAPDRAFLDAVAEWSSSALRSLQGG